jgi:hypothetical protein
MNEALRYVSEQATNNAVTAANAATETVTMMRAARCPNGSATTRSHLCLALLVPTPLLPSTYKGRKCQFLYAEVEDFECKDGVADVFAYSQKPLRL